MDQNNPKLYDFYKDFNRSTKIFLKPLNLNITLCINQMLPPGEDPQGSHELGAKGNWPFLSSKNSHFQNEAFLVTMSFICMKIKNHFQINGFVLSLALKLRLKVTQKWLIVQNIQVSCFLFHVLACFLGIIRGYMYIKHRHYFHNSANPPLNDPL